MEKKIKVKCSLCNGTGQRTEWGTNNKWLIEDCSGCAGTGKTEVIVIDTRKLTRNKPAVLPAEL